MEEDVAGAPPARGVALGGCSELEGGRPLAVSVGSGRGGEGPGGLIDLFEREFVETQEADGRQLVGQFRDLDRPDRFVWLRGFADPAESGDGGGSSRKTDPSPVATSYRSTWLGSPGKVASPFTATLPWEHVIGLDEMTGIQALERANPDLPMEPGKPVRREFEYVRHGTLCLMGAYDVRHGKLFGFVADKRGTAVFLELLEHVDACYPEGKGHLACDNLSDHLSDEVVEWLEEHPRWTLHRTPKHASWRNQIECAFSLLARRVLRRGSFRSKEELRLAIEAYLLWHNEHERPFRRTYRPKSWDQEPAQTSAGRH